MNTALIFGVTGQDGSYLSELLLSKGYKVTGVGRRTSTDNTQRIKHLLGHSRFTLAMGDVTDAGCVHRLVDTAWDSGVYEIYNLAAQSHVGVSFEQPSLTTDITYKGCLNILEVIRSWDGPRLPRFYQASSSEMFGSSFVERLREKTAEERATSTLGIGVWCLDRFQDESTPMLPNSPYAVAKLAAHNLVRIYRDSYGVHASSGILFNHESERRGENFVTRKISMWATKLYHALEKDLPRFRTDAAGIEKYLRAHPELKITLGNLDAKRDWGHAEDYVQGMWLMLQQKKADDYVLATGETHSVREFLNETLNVIGLPAGVPYDLLVETSSSLLRPCEVPYLCGDATKAKQRLGWVPTTTFKRLVERMVTAEIYPSV